MKFTFSVSIVMMLLFTFILSDAAVAIKGEEGIKMYEI